MKIDYPTELEIEGIKDWKEIDDMMNEALDFYELLKSRKDDLNG